jgi:hypothetical protein
MNAGLFFEKIREASLLTQASKKAKIIAASEGFARRHKDPLFAERCTLGRPKESVGSERLTENFISQRSAGSPILSVQRIFRSQSLQAVARATRRKSIVESFAARMGEEKPICLRRPVRLRLASLAFGEASSGCAGLRATNL